MEKFHVNRFWEFKGEQTFPQYLTPPRNMKGVSRYQQAARGMQKNILAGPAIHQHPDGGNETENGISSWNYFNQSI